MRELASKKCGARYLKTGGSSVEVARIKAPRGVGCREGREEAVLPPQKF